MSASVGAFPLATGSASAALLVTLAPGTYTAPVTGKAGITGNAIVEVYDVAADDPRLINISTRGFVGAGDAIKIPGYVVSQDSLLRLSVRDGSLDIDAVGATRTGNNPAP